MSEITNISRDLRNKLTIAEKKFWEAVRYNRIGFKIRRQYPIIFFENNVRHCFVADFICLEKKLVIEIDGKYHEDVLEHDQMRTEIINQFGYKVLRFSNEDILENINMVVQKIIKSSLPHEGGEGARSESVGRMGAYAKNW